MSHQTRPALIQPLESIRIWWGKHLDVRAFLVFQRIQRFYTTFVVLSALVSGLSVAALTFPESNPGTILSQVGEGLFCSSAITSLLAAVMATMLLFAFEGAEKATRVDLAIAWSPLVFLDLSIVEFLIAIVCWYCDKNFYWKGTLMAAQFACLLGFCIALSVWMWFHLQKKGALGIEEREATAARSRAADE